MKICKDCNYCKPNIEYITDLEMDIYDWENAICTHPEIRGPGRTNPVTGVVTFNVNKCELLRNGHMYPDCNKIDCIYFEQRPIRQPIKKVSWFRKILNSIKKVKGE